jgi:hypothetical protein
MPVAWRGDNGLGIRDKDGATTTGINVFLLFLVLPRFSTTAAPAGENKEGKPQMNADKRRC